MSFADCGTHWYIGVRAKNAGGGPIDFVADTLSNLFLAAGVRGHATIHQEKTSIDPLKKYFQPCKQTSRRFSFYSTLV